MGFTTKSTDYKNMSRDELEQQKVQLLAEINRYGLILEELDAKVANHEAQTKQYEDLSVKIAEKGKEFDMLKTTIDSLRVEKGAVETIKAEITKLQGDKVVLEEQTSHAESIIRVLQAEIVEFREMKESDIKSLEEKIKDLKLDMEKLKLLRTKHANDMQVFVDSLRK